jgi:hypothetical protein
MIRQININNDIAVLKELLESYIREDPEDLSDGMFMNVTSFTHDTYGPGIRCTVQPGAIALRAVELCQKSDNTFTVISYYGNGTDDSVVYSIKNTSTGGINKISYAYACDNGVLICFRYSSDRWMTIMITKGSDGMPFIVTPGPNTTTPASAVHGMAIRIIHITDDNYISAYLSFVDAQEQTIMCPFLGYGNTVEVTYAPYGLWIPYAPAGQRNSEFSIMTFQDSVCITNGYWAIKDTDPLEVTDND